jgi:hypothetical protein
MGGFSATQSITAFSGGCRYKADDVADLGLQGRVGGELDVCVRHGCTPKRCQILATVAYEIDVSSAASAVVNSREAKALLLVHLADDAARGPHPQRVLDQPAQRNLPGALEVGLTCLSTSRPPRGAGHGALSRHLGRREHLDTILPAVAGLVSSQERAPRPT